MVKTATASREAIIIIFFWRRATNLTAADDIWPDENFYRRSDHFNFARRGVPVLFFFCGTHEDYHGVDDEIEKMDITKATNTTKLIFYLGLEVGKRG